MGEWTSEGVGNKKTPERIGSDNTRDSAAPDVCVGCVCVSGSCMVGARAERVQCVSRGDAVHEEGGSGG